MPIITINSKDIFKTDCDILVNTVNCVGVMGRGIALEVKLRHPFIYEHYRKQCANKNISPGTLDYYKVDRCSYKYVLNFPTKRDWVDDSFIEDIELGLTNLQEKLSYSNGELYNKSIAIPKLGCGNGGLNWIRVKPLICQYLSKLPITIKIYE